MEKMSAPGRLQEFTVLEHPLLKMRILGSSSFSWPAFLLGPFWLLWKRLWFRAALLVVAIASFKLFLALSGLLKTELDCAFIQDDLQCKIYVSPWVFFVFQLAVNAVCGAFGNRWWAENLLGRGYLITKTVKAFSTDHVRALLARQKAEMKGSSDN